MEHLCPICQRKMTKEDKIKYKDYYCSPVQSDHHYSVREVKKIETKIKIRLSDSNGNLYLLVNYVEGFLQVWTKADIPHEQRTQINQIFYPDFTQIEKLRAKIRTYLTFS